MDMKINKIMKEFSKHCLLENLLCILLSTYNLLMFYFVGKDIPNNTIVLAGISKEDIRESLKW